MFFQLESLNRLKNVILVALLFVCTLAAGCSSEKKEAHKTGADTSSEDRSNKKSKTASNNSGNQRSDKEQPAINNSDFHKGLVAAAEDYLRYPLVNAVAFVAPTACKAPSPDSFAAQPVVSRSEDDSTHGKKLYYLFAKDITHYLSPESSDSPVGQVLVKESWTAKPANPDARNLRNHASGNRINPRVKSDGKILEIGKRKDLFVMMKLDPKTSETDQGWVYGVLDAGTKQVTAAGRVASCMACHESAEHDRLFGPALNE